MKLTEKEARYVHNFSTDLYDEILKERELKHPSVLFNILGWADHHDILCPYLKCLYDRDVEDFKN